jgi:hypothetical protein
MSAATSILLIRPLSPAYNPETATSNAFQQMPEADAATNRQRVQQEFDDFAATLRSEGVDVIVIDDTPSPQKPDAVFPNNWISFHADGKVILYPMFAPSRRRERRMDVVETLRKRFVITEVIDLSVYEKEGRFLEGTGSFVFDHVNKVAYASLSPRTDKELALHVSERLGYRPVIFRAVDAGGQAIYHTNVMMSVGDKFSIVCLASITDLADRKQVVDSLRDTGHTIIDIDYNQMGHFAGNMLAVRSGAGESILVCSQQAADSLTPEQRSKLADYIRLVPVPIPTIERLGGGSVRCMMAEIFLGEVTGIDGGHGVTKAT